MGTAAGTQIGTPPESELEEFGECQEPELASTLVGGLSGVPDDERWLVEGLWSAGAVGLVGGTPKTGKTFFALEIAVSVASGKPALNQFAVATPGPVVVFPAEDAPNAIRDRVAGLCAHKRVDLESLPLHVITERTIRLDEEPDRRGLQQLIRRVRPRLVVLDPLVRLHSGDENYAGHMTTLLGFLRSLQRDFGTAILLTHHVAKRLGRKGAQMGQALRGSGELHAWGDSNIYLTRTEDGLVRVEVEHRAAVSPDPLYVRLTAVVGEGTYLEVIERDEEEEDEEGGARTRQVEVWAARKELTARREAPALPLRERVLQALEQFGAPTSQVQLREVLRVRNQVLTETLRELSSEGRISRPSLNEGWWLQHEGDSNNKPPDESPAGEAVTT